MKRYFWFISGCIALAIACKKDKFQTTPQISVKSVNSNVIPQNGDAPVIFTLDYTDKEGDIRDGKFVFFPELLNVRKMAAGVEPYFPIDNIGFDPELPDKNKGEIILSLTKVELYKDIQKNDPSEDANDTLRLRFVLIDRAGNESDTAYSEPIVLLDPGH